MSDARTPEDVGDGAGPVAQAAILRRRRRIALSTLLLGVVVMVAFESTVTLLLGIVLMLGSVVAGTFLIASPGGFLDHDRPDDEDDRPAAT